MSHCFVKSVRVLILLTAVVVAALPAALCADSTPPLDYILKELEKRYTGSQFSADFLQESTIKSMEITDFAAGRVYVRYPGMMRWEYEKPEPQVIITDGHKLWIYRPLDNQVMTGNAPVFFRDGKGASFLSDIRLVRQKFTITLHPPEGEYLYELRLVPREHLPNPPLRGPARIHHRPGRDPGRLRRRHAHRHRQPAVQRRAGPGAVQVRYPAGR
jgi:outer membrane lipoprotein-sorting protein